jgi:predicted branched-subunit amino acid permease
VTLRALLRDAQFRRGARDMLAFGPALVAWAMVSGVAMTQVLGPWLAALMALTVFAGSAQLASLPLLATGAPVWVVWASAACVNLRFIVFGANWRPHLAHLPRGRRVLLGYFLADLNLVVFQKGWPNARPEPGQAAYIVGGAAVSWSIWQSASMVGIFLSSMVPTAWGIGFAGTLSMLGMAYSLLNTRVAWIAGALSATAAIAAYALPLKLNIVVAIAAAVAVGLVMQRAARGTRRVSA